MRKPLLALTVLMGLLMAPAVDQSASWLGTPVPAVVLAQEPQVQQPPSADINVNLQSDRAWYLSPLWIAVGVVGLLVVIALIVSAGRGGGTTIVRG